MLIRWPQDSGSATGTNGGNERFVMIKGLFQLTAPGEVLTEDVMRAWLGVEPEGQTTHHGFI